MATENTATNITNPLDFPRYVRSLRPSLPESLPSYVDDELEKVSTSLQELEQASNNHADALVEEERIVRVSEDEALAARIVTVAAEFNSGLATTNARISTEEIARANADEAVASRLSQLEAEYTTSAEQLSARVTTEELARATAEEALAARIDTVEASYKKGEVATNARISHENAARVTQDTALASSITSLTATVGTNTAAITAEQTARANGDSALATQISTLTTTVNGNTAAITAEQTARADGDSANASSISALNTTVGGHTSTLTTYGTSISGLQAKYGVKLDVNGYVTGFEQNNGSGTSDFIVTADKFKVVKPGSGNTPIVPFEVDGSTVRINGDLIVAGTITGNKIVTAGVDTAQLAPNSVTVPASSAGTSTAISGSGTTWQYTTLNSLTVNYSGLPDANSVIFMYVRVQLSATNGGIPVLLTLKRDGVGIKSVAYGVAHGQQNDYQFTTVFSVENPSAGSHTYSAEIGVQSTFSGGSYTGWAQAELFYQETKR